MTGEQIAGILEFLRSAERLKTVTRTSWTSEGDRESVAEHTWRLCLMAVVLGREFDDVDLARLMKMCVIHDLGEAIGGDISATLQPAGGKAAQERADLLELLRPLPETVRAEIVDLWDEYEAAATPEARIAKALDKLETIMQHNQGRNPADFDYAFNLGYGTKFTADHPLIVEIRRILDEETSSRAAATGARALHTDEPIALFREWHDLARGSGVMSHPNAMCVSTVDATGAPHARLVDLKAVRPDGFVFCTSHASPKGRHVEARPELSLTFWWDHVGRQVRVLGTASPIPPQEADRFFAERSRDAQIASWAFDQSETFKQGETSATRLDAAQKRFGSGPVPRPPHWGGFVVKPRRVEFLLFRDDRVHERLLYELQDAEWTVTELQP